MLARVLLLLSVLKSLESAVEKSAPKYYSVRQGARLDDDFKFGGTEFRISYRFYRHSEVRRTVEVLIDFDGAPTSWEGFSNLKGPGLAKDLGNNNLERQDIQPCINRVLKLIRPPSKSTEKEVQEGDCLGFGLMCTVKEEPEELIEQIFREYTLKKKNGPENQRGLILKKILYKKGATRQQDILMEAYFDATKETTKIQKLLILRLIGPKEAVEKLSEEKLVEDFNKLVGVYPITADMVKKILPTSTSKKENRFWSEEFEIAQERRLESLIPAKRADQERFGAREFV